MAGSHTSQRVVTTKVGLNDTLIGCLPSITHLSGKIPALVFSALLALSFLAFQLILMLFHMYHFCLHLVISHGWVRIRARVRVRKASDLAGMGGGVQSTFSDSHPQCGPLSKALIPHRRSTVASYCSDAET